MSRFTSHLGLNLLEYSTGRPVLRGDRCLWYLPTPLSYEEGYEGSGRVITVPAFDPTGYSDLQLSKIRCRGVTDLASVPWPGRGLIPPDGPWVKGAVLHDDGYVTGGWGGQRSRAQVDKLLLESMEVLGCPAWKRSIIYAAVRVGGGRSFGT